MQSRPPNISSYLLLGWDTSAGLRAKIIAMERYMQPNRQARMHTPVLTEMARATPNVGRDKAPRAAVYIIVLLEGQRMF